MNRSNKDHNLTHTTATAVADGVSDVLHAGADRLGGVADAVTDKYDMLSSGLKDQISGVRDQAQQIRKNIEGTVSARPITALLIAGGIGLLLGALYTRRR